MFEKEAEIYAGNREVCDLLDAISEDLQNYDYGTVAHYNIDPLVEECFKDGAEFGYNKANEWHYPSKGEYPKAYKDILICFLTEEDMKDCVRGWYEYDLDVDKHYFKTVNIFGTAVIKNVYAWKEIELPELKESE